MTSSVTRSPANTVRTPGGTSRTQATERTDTTRSTRGTQTTQPGRGSATERSSRSSFTQAGSATGSLRPGARGEAVRSLQEKLRSAGFDPGPSDGVFGERTERAVRDFQRARGLQVDGVVGRRTRAALNGTDGMDRPAAGGAGGVDPNRPTSGNAANGTARLNNQPAGRGLATGTITVNGRSYQFNSGSRNLFSVPQGEYRVTAHRNSRSDAGFTRDGVGFSFRIEDANRPNSDRMYDARAGRDRSLLRIHPDGGARGTEGCIGIVGDAATLRQFREDMNAELRRNGGTYTLRVS
jgi:hypothetical protein